MSLIRLIVTFVLVVTTVLETGTYDNTGFTVVIVIVFLVTFKLDAVKCADEIVVKASLPRAKLSTSDI